VRSAVNVLPLIVSTEPCSTIVECPPRPVVRPVTVWVTGPSEASMLNTSIEPAPTVHAPPSDARAAVGVGVGFGVGRAVIFGVGRDVGFGVGRADGFVAAWPVAFVVGFEVGVAVPPLAAGAFDSSAVGSAELSCDGSMEEPAEAVPDGTAA